MLNASITAFGDVWFDQWLVIRGEGLRVILDMALRSIQHQEERRRVRKRRATDQRTLEAMVETVIANLARAVLTQPDAPSVAVALTKSKTLTRYDRHIFRQLRDVLTKLQREGFLHLTIPAGRGFTSTMSPHPWFLSKMRENRVTIADLGQHPDEETIWLAKSEWGFGDQSGTFAKRRKLIDYTSDTRDSHHFREEMRTINRHLEAARIGMAAKYDDPMPDLSRYALRRNFTLPTDASAKKPRFDLGGRLFGGWWQNLPKADRHMIRIDGEPIADLDFASMFPRLAFIAVGLEPPEGDIYAIPGLEGYRGGVKALISALLFAEGERQRLPSEIKSQLPPGMTVADVRKLVLQRHPSMAAILEKGLGLRLMFAESKIMVATLLDLNSQGITALAMHDGLMVARSRAEQARVAMQRAAKAVTGHALPVEVKGTAEERAGEGEITYPAPLQGQPKPTPQVVNPYVGQVSHSP